MSDDLVKLVARLQIVESDLSSSCECYDLRTEPLCAPCSARPLIREAAAALEALQSRLKEAERHIKTAIGSLDDPTGPHIIEDVRRVRDVVLIDALVALKGGLLSTPSSEEEKM